MTDAVAPADGVAGLVGARVDGAGVGGAAVDGAAVDGAVEPMCRPGGSESPATPVDLTALALAEAVRTAIGRPPEEGARLLLELAVAAGPWSSAAVARRLPSGAWGTWTGSSPLAQVCDPVQWEIGEGPAREALVAGLVTVSPLIGDGRWPAWQTQVAALGARSVAAVRLHAGTPLGVLTAYGVDPVAPAGPAVDHLRTMAALLSVLLDSADRRANLERAMVNRGVIGQAIGVLVERYGITSDQAFATLRRMSQDENVKMSQLATVLVRTGDLPGLHLRGG